ncbi:PREDICTED: uncharacterized protein LOC108764848 isoform X3 [Trachymyrmex cornetzi]|uniref:uncharacterized protein LOC108764848 isoform X3 n=1 Tax=Trachymyrmex cornetzi TaxID=471704 RepID=UPI00084F4B6A|nr:PREDICTED: uncharacterized protein LOC108764848 isoform X3 [Trachymyrmex cornetzi]XP_018368752.1 PREDICTED: uncharacterized protein LOC108764848 isoform X3 [Trachymyrmex cornetzi]
MKQVSFYSTLTAEERTRTHPCKKTRCVIMSSDDQSSPAQTSISTTSFDVLDNARLEKINITPIMSQPTKPVISSITNTDADAIEEAVSVVQTTLPIPELQPKIEKNGIETKTKKTSDEPNDDCLINCIYYTQQCCDCTIV